MDSTWVGKGQVAEEEVRGAQQGLAGVDGDDDQKVPQDHERVEEREKTREVLARRISRLWKRPSKTNSATLVLTPMDCSTLSTDTWLVCKQTDCRI